MKKKDRKITTQPKPLMKEIEDFGLMYRKAVKKIMRKRTKGKNIVIRRMCIVEIPKDLIGECDNISDEELEKGQKRDKVKTGDMICGVGVVRKGRNWGDYSGVFCGECPYFLIKSKDRKKIKKVIE